MAEQRYSEKFCKLKKTNVTVLEEPYTERGTDGVMEWDIRECSDENDECENLDCKYVCKGIGDCGKIDPFN